MRGASAAMICSNYRIHIQPQHVFELFWILNVLFIKERANKNRSKVHTNQSFRANITEVFWKQYSWKAVRCLYNLDPHWGWINQCETLRHTCKLGPIISSPLISPFFSFIFKKLLPRLTLLYSLSVLPQSIHLALNDPVSKFCFRTWYCRSSTLHGLVLFIPSLQFLFMPVSPVAIWKKAQKRPRETRPRFQTVISHLIHRKNLVCLNSILSL